MANRNIAIRLSVKEGGKVKAELKEVGSTGKKSLKKIEKAGKRSSRGLLALSAASNDMRGAATGLSAQIGPLGSGLAALGPAGIAAAVALAAMTLGLKSAIAGAMEAEQAQNRLQGVLKATGYASGFTGQEIADMADQMEGSTLTTAEAVKGAAAVMATFRSVSGDTFKKSIHLAKDMSAVFGQDLRGSATQLGKALEDPVKGISALNRVGVSFSDSQKDVIAKFVETGKQAKAQGLILAALEGQVGGAARAEAQGLTGAAHRLTAAWGEMLDTIGETETVGGTAQYVLNLLASTSRITTEVLSAAPLTKQLRDAKQELIEVEKELIRIRDISSYFQPRGNVAKHEEQSADLRHQIKSLEDAIDKEKEEKKKAIKGKKVAEAERIRDLVSGRSKGYQETIDKFLDKDPANQVAKLNKELEQSVAFFKSFRTVDNSTEIDKAIETTRKAIAIKIGDIENPIAAAAQKEMAANQKIIDGMKQKLLGMGDERQAFIDSAVERLSGKATEAQRGQTAKWSGQFFDEKVFHEAQKVVDGLNDKIKELGMTARQLSINEAVSALPEMVSPSQIIQVRDLASALFDQKAEQEQLDKLRGEGKSITEEAKTATEKYAEKIERLNNLLNAGSISQGTYNRSLEGLGAEQLASRTDPAAGILRAYENYKDGAEDTAATVEKAFTQAMTATEDAIVGMVTSGEVSLNSLNDLAGSVVADITRMLIKQEITTPLFGMLTGGGGAGGDDGAGFLGSIVSAFFHEGGRVGDPAPTRAMPAHVFAGAPRYHNGGIAGLKPDEVPAILRKGEEVIPPNKRGRSSAINMVMHVSTPNADSFRASQGQILAQATKGMNRAKRNM